MTQPTRTKVIPLGPIRPTQEEMHKVGKKYNLSKCNTFEFMGQWYANVTYPNPAILPIDNQTGE